MYVPTQFRIEDVPAIHSAMRMVRLSTLVTLGPEGLIGTPLPLMLEAGEGELGTLYGHVARANQQWRMATTVEAMAIFAGLDAYVTPSWYPTKFETGKVVPTWNYVAVHAYGPVEFFDNPSRLLEVVTRLTLLQEGPRQEPWAVNDAPMEFIQAQLRGIVGVRLPITRLDAKSKMSQNRNAADRAGVAAGLAASGAETDRAVAALIPE